MNLCSIDLEIYTRMKEIVEMTYIEPLTALELCERISVKKTKNTIYKNCITLQSLGYLNPCKRDKKDASDRSIYAYKATKPTFLIDDYQPAETRRLDKFKETAQKAMEEKHRLKKENENKYGRRISFETEYFENKLRAQVEQMRKERKSPKVHIGCSANMV